jgi:hypothetical protein
VPQQFSVGEVWQALGAFQEAKPLLMSACKPVMSSSDACGERFETLGVAAGKLI